MTAECICFQIINKDVPQGSDHSQAMYIRVHTPMRRLGSTNRPLAVLSAVDNDLGLQLLQQGKIHMHTEMERFKAIIVSQVWFAKDAQLVTYSIVCMRCAC
jgi:hypothetical protein